MKKNGKHNMGRFCTKQCLVPRDPDYVVNEIE
jgi:hypothetical protein